MRCKARSNLTMSPRWGRPVRPIRHVHGACHQGVEQGQYPLGAGRARSAQGLEASIHVRRQGGLAAGSESHAPDGEFASFHVFTEEQTQVLVSRIPAQSSQQVIQGGCRSFNLTDMATATPEHECRRVRSLSPSPSPRGGGERRESLSRLSR